MEEKEINGKFVKNADSIVAGQRPNREKLIQAPLLTQNLKKFRTRCEIIFCKSSKNRTQKVENQSVNKCNDQMLRRG